VSEGNNSLSKRGLPNIRKYGPLIQRWRLGKHKTIDTRCWGDRKDWSAWGHSTTETSEHTTASRKETDMDRQTDRRTG